MRSVPRTRNRKASEDLLGKPKDRWLWVTERGFPVGFQLKRWVLKSRVIFSRPFIQQVDKNIGTYACVDTHDYLYLGACGFVWGL